MDRSIGCAFMRRVGHRFSMSGGTQAGGFAVFALVRRRYPALPHANAQRRQ